MKAYFVYICAPLDTEQEEIKVKCCKVKILGSFTLDARLYNLLMLVSNKFPQHCEQKSHYIQRHQCLQIMQLLWNNEKEIQHINYTKQFS